MLAEIMPDMSLTQLGLVALAVMFAALMRAFSGFGFALMAVPVFSLFLSPGDSVVLSAILTLVISALTYKAWWGKFPTQVAPAMIGGSVVGTAIGVYFLSNASVDQFRLWIGLSVIVGCIALARFKPGDHEPSAGLSGGTGIVSGLMNGAFAIPGPPVVLFVMATIHQPVQARAFLMMFFFVSNVISMSMFTAAGVVTANPFYLFVIAFPVMLAGDRIGAWAFTRLGGRAYRPIVMGVCVMVGVAITARALL
jgi:uncharacterized membrane protein YfcA